MVELAVQAAIVYGTNYALSQPKIGLLSQFGGPGLNNPLYKTRNGARLGSLQIQETAEGAPDNRCFGPKNRVAGALVWMSDLKEVKKSESGGGKGGGGGEFITYHYYASVLIRLCRAATPISRIPSIWADGKLLFNLDTDISYSSNGIDTKITDVLYYQGGVPTPYARTKMHLESDTNLGRPDLSKIKSGNTVTVSGYTGGSLFSNLQLIATPTTGGTTITLRATTSSVALLVGDVIEFQGYDLSYSVSANVTVPTSAGGISVSLSNTIAADKPIGSSGTPTPALAKRGNQINNGTFLVTAASIDPDPIDTKISRVSVIDAKNQFRKFVAVAVGTTIAIVQTNAPFKASQVGRVDILTGGPDQQPPDILQRYESADISQIYGMRNRAGFALTDVDLTDWGNRVPNFEGLVEVTADAGKVADVIRTVLTDDADWPASGIDVSGVTGEFLGLSFRTPQPPKQSLQTIMAAFDVVAWEKAGKLYFANRTALQTVTVEASEVGTYGDEEQQYRSLRLQDPPRDGLPSEIVVSYRSPTNDLQISTKRARRTERIQPDVQTVDFDGLVISDDEAQRIADRVLAVTWGARRGMTVSLPQSRIGQVREGMILTINGAIYGQSWSMLVERVDRGANMLLVATGTEHDPKLLEQTATSEGTFGLSASGNTQDGGHSAQAPVELGLLDVPALSDQHRDEPGIYVVGHNSDPARPWRGAVLYWSRDDGVTWNRVAEVPIEAACGELVTAPTVTVLPDMWDRANTIRIRIRHTQVQLGSVSEESCLAGANRFLVGREIIGAASVVFVESDPVDGARVYDLSTLLRGQHDTDQSMGEHVEGEQVVWLDGPGVQYVPLSYSHVDRARLWRLVPNGGYIQDAPSYQIQPTARNCRPFHVRNASGVRDGSNNLTLTWERTPRVSRLLFEHGEPLDEEVEAYEIDVVLAGVVKRTIAVSGARTALYTVAQQTTDGTVGGPTTFRFYQLSAGLLRGQESEFSI